MKDDLVKTGRRWNTEALLAWSGRIVAAARQDLDRLKKRGVSERTLRDIETARADVDALNLKQEKEKKDVQSLAAPRRRAIDQALDWRAEVKGLAAAALEDRPDVRARFRTGIRSTRDLPKLIAEIGRLLDALERDLAAFKAVGATAALVNRGREALRGLKDVSGRRAHESAERAPASAGLYKAQGTLFLRTRLVVRLAAVEFRSEAPMRRRYPPRPPR